MAKGIFLQNLNSSMTKLQIQDLMAEFGTVETVNLLKDPSSGNFMGECIVVMDSAVAAESAFSGLNGKLIQGRVIRVNEAND
jgi:RNA recognition motif-containing protein